MPAPAAETAALPNINNLFYSFDYGGVHFIAYSSEHDLNLQTAFIEADLAQAAARRSLVPWVVVFAHRPIYCSTNDYFDCKVSVMHKK